MTWLVLLLTLFQPPDPVTPVTPATSTEAGITFPTVISPPVEPVIPRPGTPTNLPQDVFYIIYSDVPFLVFSFPDNMVRITHEEGPVKIRGKFVEAPDKVITKTYKSKHIAIVENLGRTGPCELLVLPSGATKEEQGIRKQLTLSQLPNPPNPVDPVDPVIPTPPTPAPIPVAGFRVLMIYETKDAAKMPKEQFAVLNAQAIRDYLDSHCVVGPDGKTKDWRIWDQNVDASAENKIWRDAMARPRASIPWIVISNGKTGYEGPLPANVTAALELLRKYGGQ